jgi:hypothetical protein
MSSLVGRASTPAVGLQTRLRQTPAALDHGKSVSGFSQPSVDGIVDNVSLDAPGLFAISHQMIVTFILPKRLAPSTEQSVGLSRAIALQPAQELRYVAVRRDEQVNVIWHNHPCMHITIRRSAMSYATADQLGDLRPFQMDGSEARRIEQAVHRDKRLPGGQACFREFTPSRQAAMQPKGNEQRSPDGMNMRQTTM